MPLLLAVTVKAPMEGENRPAVTSAATTLPGRVIRRSSLATTGAQQLQPSTKVVTRKARTEPSSVRAGAIPPCNAGSRSYPASLKGLKLVPRS